MNTQDTLIALKVRRDLTGESFNDGTIAVWTEALTHWPLPQVRTAIIHAGKDHNRITIAHVHEQLPPLVHTTPHLEHCELCDGTGWLDDTPAPTDTTPVPSGRSKPCRCTRGTQMIETQRRILEANRR